MKIVADENILLVDHYFKGHELYLKSGRNINHNDLIDADILLVRSVTKVDENLLKNTSVKFVGSVTSGMDHIDTHYLNAEGIRWSIAAGCNAKAVSDYVVCVIAAIQKEGFLLERNLRAAVIGVGAIGKLVVEQLKILGFDVLLCDPVRAQNEKEFDSVSLDSINNVDFISLHTPLTYSGDFPTYHMINKNFLERQKPGCVILNSGRGSVIDFTDLKLFKDHLHWCLDVWENEPTIDLSILTSSLIATPHIAGYSIQSKYRGIESIYKAAVQQKIISDMVESVPFPRKKINLHNKALDWQEVILQIYNPIITSQLMKESLLKDNTLFDNLRKQFADRVEFDCVSLENVKLHALNKDMLVQLFKL